MFYLEKLQNAKYSEKRGWFIEKISLVFRTFLGIFTQAEVNLR